MKKLLAPLRSSLSARLSLEVVLFVAIIFVGAFTIMFTETRDVIKQEAWGKATQTLDGTVTHINNTLERIEVASDNMLRVIEQNLDKPDSMFSFSRQVLINNQELTGCSISFDPFYYKEKGRYFSAYSFNDGDSIQTEQEGTDNYQYHCMDWYLIPRLLGRPYWIEPFMEDATEGIIVKDIFSSYSRPIHDIKGNSVGTFSVDIRLSWFTKTIAEAKPYPNSFCVMLGKGGSYLVHPDTTKLFYETIFTRTLDKPDSMKTALGTAMLAGESGHMVLEYDGETCHVFYRPFKNTGWSVAIVIPENDIFAPYQRLKSTTLWISSVGLLFLLFFSLVTIRNGLKPLKQLAETTRHIAQGKFSATAAMSQRIDEIGRLQRSFTKMQQSLDNYINELRSETNALEKRNKKLQEAYEHARDEERMKTTILHKMPDKMALPVAEISKAANQVCGQHHDKNAPDINEVTKKMQDHANQITALLDEMIRTAQEESQTSNTNQTKDGKELNE